MGKSKANTNTSTLKYIENFSNPYVKIILVCKICNKEQSLKFSHNWKTHYLSHVSNEEKPHKCQFCPKAFVTAPQLKKHMKQHIVDIKGVCILEDEWEDAKITITRNGIADTIEFDKSDIVKTEEVES